MNGRALLLPSVVERRSLREEVADALRSALISGAMQPGAIYSVPALARQLGVSATPVREAMLDLAKENLVEPVRNKGFRPIELSDEDLDDFTAIRELIEIPTMVQIARTVAAERLEPMRSFVDEMERAVARGDVPAFVDADTRFHLAVLALAGNDHLVEVVRGLRNRSRLYGLAGLAQAGRLEPFVAEHRRLLDALIAGDTEEVARLMKTHMRQVRGAWAADRDAVT